VYTSLFSPFFFIWWGGVRLSPLGTLATNRPTVPATDDIWVWSILWNDNWRGKQKYSDKTYPNATLPTTNPMWPNLRTNPGRRSGKSAGD
jgi:hypothetical protein